jgi:hypothetical protein
MGTETIAVVVDKWSARIEVALCDDGDIVFWPSGPECDGELCFTPHQLADLKRALASVDTPPASMTTIEEAIYAAAYGQRMERFLTSAAWMSVTADDNEFTSHLREELLADRVAKAKANAEKAVELYRASQRCTT